MSKRLLFVSAGHSSKPGRDNGAKATNGKTEGQLTEEFRNIFVEECKKICVTCNVDGSDTILNDTINLFKKYTNKDSILIEFHFNAGVSTATGTEVLIPIKKEASSIELELAKELSAACSKVLNIKDRGVKGEDESARGRLGWMRLAGHNILPEICFISNAHELMKYNTYKKELAKQWALIVSKYL